jgi:hypothetical protein
MLQFDPKDPGDTPYKIRRIVDESGLTQQKICDRLETEYGVKTSTSSLSRTISNGTMQLQMALQVMAICGVSEIGIKGKIHPQR